MALIVEDGTGLVDADSYQSIADADTYAENFGLAAWNALSGDVDEVTKKEVALRNATLAIDVSRTYKSIKLDPDQSLEFPRYDPLIGMPQKVRDASVLLADLYVQGVDINAQDEVLNSISVGVGSGAVTESKGFASPLVVSTTNQVYNLLRDYISSDPNDGFSQAAILRS